MADSKKSKLFNKYLSRMATIKKDAYAAELFAGLEAGKNSYMRIDRLESSNFDMTWINQIEDCIYELGDIVANPKQVTKTVTGIVPVELARKTGAESVQHLASHTQYIKEIAENGDVVPNKILNIGSEEDIHTYENRFIATLIRRLVLFVEKRYEIIKKFSVLHDEEILYYKTKAIVDGSEVEIETKIKVKSESDTEAAIQSNSYVNRIVKLREYIMYFYGSKFMKELKTERDVRNPILMTNILRKNTKYHKCYELFRFLERYDKLGVSYKLDEDASIFSDEELSELNTVMLTNYLALKARDRSKVTKGFSRTYKPRILTSLDDEQFIYGDLLRGPIEFLRVDEGYQKYLDEQLRKDLPTHPTKIEKEYYQEELEEKNTRKVEKAALDKLVKRKKKEQAEFDRRAKAIVAQREKEEAERAAREADEARREEERRIEEVRQALVRDAKFGNDTNPESIEGESDVIETPAADIVEEAPVEEEPIVEEPAPEEEPVEEIPTEEPQEEVQPEQEPVSEESTPEEIVEEQLAEEEAPIEEQPVESEQLSEEQVEEELESPEEIEEVIEGEELGVIEEPVQEEQPVEEVPAEEPTPEEDIDAIRQQLVADALSEEENVPEEAPVDEPVEEAPVEEEVQSEPEQLEEQPVAEQEPAPVKKPAKKRKKRKKVVKKPKEEPQPEVVEEAPVEEQPVEQVEEAPVEEASVEEPVAEETPAEEPAPQEEKPKRARKPRKKKEVVVPEEPQEEPEPAPQEIVEETPIEEPVSEEPEIEENNEIPEEKPTSAEKKPVKKKKKKKKAAPKPKEEPAKIPGRFIVKTNEGYYVNSHKYSVYKHEAFVFDDFNAANKIKAKHGGKVVKL